MAARNFNQGFATVEYLASAFVDLALHRRKDLSNLDVSAFEKETLQTIGMPREIIMRHRTPHFTRFLGRRLFVGLLQLSLVGGSGRGCLYGFRGDR